MGSCIECQETSFPHTQEAKDKGDQKMYPEISHEESKALEEIEEGPQASRAEQPAYAESLNHT